MTVFGEALKNAVNSLIRGETPNWQDNTESRLAEQQAHAPIKIDPSINEPLSPFSKPNPQEHEQVVTEVMNTTLNEEARKKLAQRRLLKMKSNALLGVENPRGKDLTRAT